jgi:hypothetical protein
MSMEISIQKKKTVVYEYVPELMSLGGDADAGDDYTRLINALSDLAQIDRYMTIDKVKRVKQVRDANLTVKPINLMMLTERFEQLVELGKPETQEERLALADKIIQSAKEKGAQQAFADITESPKICDAKQKRGFLASKPDKEKIAREAKGLSNDCNLSDTTFDWVRNYQTGNHDHRENAPIQNAVNSLRTVQDGKYGEAQKKNVIPEITADDKNQFILDALISYRDILAETDDMPVKERENSASKRSELAANAAMQKLAEKKGLADFSHVKQATESPIVEKLKLAQESPGFFHDHKLKLGQIEIVAATIADILTPENIEMLKQMHQEKAQLLAQSYLARAEQVTDTSDATIFEAEHKALSELQNKNYEANRGLQLLGRTDIDFTPMVEVSQASQVYFGKLLDTRRVQKALAKELTERPHQAGGSSSNIDYKPEQ